MRVMGRFIARYYSIFLLLAAYEAMSRFGLVSPRLFPSLVVIAEQLWKYTANGDLIYQAGISLHRALLGFILALIAGVLLGTVIARSRLIEALIEPLFVFSYPIPKIALYPVFIFVFGLGTEFEGGAGFSRMPLSDRDPRPCRHALGRPRAHLGRAQHGG